LLLRLLQRRKENQSVSAHVLNFSTVWMAGGRLHVQTDCTRSVGCSVGFRDGVDGATSVGAPVVTRTLQSFIAYSVGCIENLKYQTTYPSVHETAICHNPQNLSNRDFSIIRQFGYKNTFCQNVVHKKVKFFRRCIFLQT